MAAREGLPAEVSTLEPLLTADEVAQMCNVSKRWIQAQAAANMIPGAIRLGRLWRFRRSGIEQWLADKERSAAPSPRGWGTCPVEARLPAPSIAEAYERALRPTQPSSKSPFHARDAAEACERFLRLKPKAKGGRSKPAAQQQPAEKAKG